MNNKIGRVIEGLIIAALGVLVAIYGGGSVVDVYFAIIALISGAGCLLVALFSLSKSKELDYGLVIIGVIALFIGFFLFTDWLSFSMLINILIVVLMGLGAALIFCGLYTTLRKSVFYGVGQITVGALIIIFTALYIGVTDFRTVFWIVIGVIIAVYGVFAAISALVSKK